MALKWFIRKGGDHSSSFSTVIKRTLENSREAAHLAVRRRQLVLERKGETVGSVFAGLQPSIGLHHMNRSKAFCLADDLIEPFRPMLGRQVRQMARVELNQAAKAKLLNLLAAPLRLGDQTGPWMVMVHRLTASLVRCFAGKSPRLEILEPCQSADTE